MFFNKVKSFGNKITDKAKSMGTGTGNTMKSLEKFVQPRTPIEEIRDLLEMSKYDHDPELKVKARKKLDAYVKSLLKIKTTQPLTESEYNDIEAIANALGVRIEDQYKNLLQNRFALSVLVERNQLPRPYTSYIQANFQKDEDVYYCDIAILRKWKTVVQKLGYGGFRLSVPICKGVSYRAGTISPAVNKKSVLDVADQGSLCITSKRIFFVGANENFSWPINKIMNMGANSDGLIIQRENNVNPKIITLPRGYDLPLLILSNLVNDVPMTFIGESSPRESRKEVKSEKSKRPVKKAANISIDDLPKLKKLLDEGIITQEEFDAAKKKVLGG